MTDDLLGQYAAVAGLEEIDRLYQLAKPLRGARVVHVNSTFQGGGVAEILDKLIPLKKALGLDAEWTVITGEPQFYQCTKSFHNALQGNTVGISDPLLRAYEETNERFAEEHRQLLEEADFVFIHDPQPAAILGCCPNRQGKWIWRCHIDAHHPYRKVWKYLREFVSPYDASIFSLADFAQPLPHPQYLIPPSIDPLSEKNREIPEHEVREVFNRYQLDVSMPLIVQISRFDRFKDPLGVIEAYRIARQLTPLQLVLAGGGAIDDPEGEAVLEEVRQAASDDFGIRIIVLPPDAHQAINAIQRAADIIVQKSIREGFGLTVTEGMWKGKPIIGGDTGGIRLQVINHQTGFLVRSPEGAALRIRYLLHRRDVLDSMGRQARKFVRENFLITRLLREHLSLMIRLRNGNGHRIEVG